MKNQNSTTLDTEITLNHFNAKIKNIKALTYLLGNSGPSEFVSYHISFKPNGVSSNLQCTGFSN